MNNDLLLPYNECYIEFPNMLWEAEDFSWPRTGEVRYQGAANLKIVANMFFLLSDPREFFISI